MSYKKYRSCIPKFHMKNIERQNRAEGCYRVGCNHVKTQEDARCTNNKANRRVLSGCLTTMSKGKLQHNESPDLSKDE